MKTEQHPEASGYAFKSVKEVEANVRRYASRLAPARRHHSPNLSLKRRNLGAATKKIR